MMSKVGVLRVALLACAVLPAYGWMTRKYNSFSFTCPSGQIMHTFESEHDNIAEDRLWNFYCRNLEAGTTVDSCSWSGYVNGYEDDFDYSCPSNSVLAGISSDFTNNVSDRRFRFYCCPLSGATTSSCAQTGYVNDYDDPLHYSVACTDVIVGVKSVFNRWRYDRRFDFQYCAKS